MAAAFFFLLKAKDVAVFTNAESMDWSNKDQLKVRMCRGLRSTISILLNKRASTEL